MTRYTNIKKTEIVWEGERKRLSEWELCPPKNNTR